MISIVIPVYNIESDLPKCLDSVIAQTYSDIEIIVVDDGSVDNSGKICDKYASSDERMRVIHKENGGLVSARKIGAELSKGELIFLVDGDDWIEPDTLELMLRHLDDDCDLVQCAPIYEYKDMVKKTDTSLKGYFNLKEEDNAFLRNLFVDEDNYSYRGVRSNIWGCLMRRELYLTCQFNVPDVMSRGEDDACYYPMILKANAIYEMEEYLYHYNQRSDSMTHKRTSFESYECVFLYNIINPFIECHPAKEILQRPFFAYLMHRTNDHFIHSLGIGYRLVSYSFPLYSMCTNKKIVIYGAGRVGQDYLKCFGIRESKIDIVAIIDKNKSGSMGTYEIVNNIDILNEIEFDYVVIAIMNGVAAEEIIESLINKGIKRELILWAKPHRQLLAQLCFSE